MVLIIGVPLLYASNILNVQQKVNEEIGNKIKQEEEAKLAAEAQAKLESEQQQAQQSQKNTSVESDSLANASGLTSNTSQDWNSAEHLISYQSQYAYGIVVNYNTSCTPGLGSAIFFHCSTGNGTYGCISVPESVLVSIMQSIKSNCLIVIAIGDNIYNY